MILLWDALAFAVIAVLGAYARRSFNAQPCERLEQPCPCQSRKRDERGRFAR